MAEVAAGDSRPTNQVSVAFEHRLYGAVQHEGQGEPDHGEIVEPEVVRWRGRAEPAGVSGLPRVPRERRREVTGFDGRNEIMIERTLRGAFRARPLAAGTWQLTDEGATEVYLAGVESDVADARRRDRDCRLGGVVGVRCLRQDLGGSAPLEFTARSVSFTSRCPRLYDDCRSSLRPCSEAFLASCVLCFAHARRLGRCRDGAPAELAGGYRRPRGTASQPRPGLLSMPRRRPPRGVLGNVVNCDAGQG